MNPIPDTLPMLETERLRLRNMAATDAADLFAIYGDAEVMRFASDPPFPAPATVLVMLASVERLLQESESLEWGIEQKQTRRLIGTVGLHGFRPTINLAEVGCLLARTEWGQGIMSEALAAVLEYAKNILRVQILRAQIDTPNTKSRRLFERLGFQQLNDTTYELPL